MKLYETIDLWSHGFRFRLRRANSWYKSWGHGANNWRNRHLYRAVRSPPFILFDPMNRFRSVRLHSVKDARRWAAYFALRLLTAPEGTTIS